MKNKLKDDFEDRLINALKTGIEPSRGEMSIINAISSANQYNLERLRRGYPKLVEFLIKNPYYPKSSEDKIRELRVEVEQIKSS